mmetsp:Transcript_10248/g.23334  ORF Transcript_10248/g.23334 Transcript_10248/m.23334 type:complete len:297 (-) Transcript_10248:68-958(-)
MDVDVGQNASTLFTNDRAWCQQHAEDHGYGGFAVWNGVAYFRAASGPELRARLLAARGVTCHLFEPSARGQRATEASGGNPFACHDTANVRSARARSMSVPPSLSTRPRQENPLNIRFTHDEISDAFQPRGAEVEGQRLDDVIQAILDGEASADEFPPLCVVDFAGDLYSLSNRRLFVFRVLAMHEALEHANIQLVPMSSRYVQRLAYDPNLGREASKWDRAYTTRNQGQTVRVRGRGSRFLDMQWPRDEARDAHEASARNAMPAVPRSGRARTRITLARRRRNTLSPDPNYEWRQ